MSPRAPKLGRRGLALAALLLSAIAVTGRSGVAADRAPGPKLSRSSATVVANVEREDVSFCTGSGGEHFKVDLLIRGPIHSSDPRLAGEFVGHVRVLVKRVPLDGDALIGHGRDDFEVRGSDGTLKAKGTGFFVFDLGKPLRGMLFATLRDGSAWISNFSVMNNLVSIPIVVDDSLRRLGAAPIGARGPIVVEMGGPATLNPGDPGLIQTGSCPGGLGPDPLREPPLFP